MYYNFRQFPVLINGSTVITESCDISFANELSPSLTTQKHGTTDYVATNNINGSINLNYYYTGNDPIKSYINTETGYISGYFGGLFVKSGVLTSYSVKGTPVSPVIVSANLSFFEQLGGALNTTATPTRAVDDYKIVNFSDCSLTSSYSTNVDAIENISEFSYSFTRDVRPVYTVNTGLYLNNLIPDRVYLGAKQVETTFICDHLTGTFPLTGKNQAIILSFRHPNVSLNDNLTCSGLVTSKTVSFKTNDYVKSQVSVIQSITENPPQITGVNPNYAYAGNFMRISGVNLNNLTSLYFEDMPAENYYVLSDTLISGIIPTGAISGNIKLNTFGGYAEYPYNLTYPNILITGVTPISGKYNDSIIISGLNFYRIDKVMFGTGLNGSAGGKTTGVYNVLDGQTIEAKVPYSGIWDYISVISTIRQKSGVSPFKFAAYPQIYGFTPNTGLSGINVTISGYNFTGVNGVWFNDILSPTYSVTANTGILAKVPSGNAYGYVSISGASGVRVYSDTYFYPEVIMTGVYPSSIAAGGQVVISGLNFQSGLLYNLGDDTYQVSFNGGVTGMTLWMNNSMTGLSGYLPASAQTGPIYIYKTDGAATYVTTGNYTKIYGTPVLTSITPDYSYTGQYYNGFIEGSELFNITSVRFSGIDETYTLNKEFIVPSSYLVDDVLGYRLNIVNYTGFTGGLPLHNYTGTYQVQAIKTLDTGFLDTDYPFTLLPI